MNSYFTRLKGCMAVHLYGVLSVMTLLCFTQTSLKAQIPADCANAKMYYYNVLGFQSGAYPLTAGKFSGGTLDGVTIANGVNNLAPGAKYTGISNGYYTFSTATGQEYYNYATGVKTFPTRPLKLLPLALTTLTPAERIVDPFKGEEINSQDPNFIDMDGYIAILKNPYGPGISLYSLLTCNKVINWTWPTFTGGNLNGQVPSRANINMGAEDYLYHNNGNDIERYSVSTGNFLNIANSAASNKIFSNGPLMGIALGAAVGGGLQSTLPAPNAHIVYIGMDEFERLTFYNKTTNVTFQYYAVTLDLVIWKLENLSGANNPDDAAIDYNFSGDLPAVLSPN